MISAVTLSVILVLAFAPVGDNTSVFFPPEAHAIPSFFLHSPSTAGLWLPPLGSYTVLSVVGYY